MKNKKLIIALIALVAVVAIMVGISVASRPGQEPDQNETQSQTGSTGGTEGSTAPEFKYNITVIVVHMDGEEKTFTYQTNDEYLGPVLVAEGLVEEAASPGMYDTVDGVKADWNVDQSYWAFYVGEEYAMQGMDDTHLTDGAVYKLVHTK